MKFSAKHSLALVPLVAFALPGSSFAQQSVLPQVGTSQNAFGAVATTPVGTSACSSCVPMPVSGSVSITGTISTSDTISSGSISLVPSASAGVGITPSITGTSVSTALLKASPGNLYSAYLTAGTISGFLMLFNSSVTIANAMTTIGTAAGNLVDCIQAPALSTTAINYSPGPPEVFSSGILAMFSSTGCGSLTASSTAQILHGSVQ